MTRKRKIIIHFGRIDPRHPNYGHPLECYVCGATHPIRNIAMIEVGRNAKIVPLCEACLAADDKTSGVAKKFWNAPDLVTHKATPEQLAAYDERCRNPFDPLH